MERPPHVAGPLGAAAAETTTQKDENQTENFDSFDDLNLCTVIFERILVIFANIYISKKQCETVKHERDDDLNSVTQTPVKTLTW